MVTDANAYQVLKEIRTSKMDVMILPPTPPPLTYYVICIAMIFLRHFVTKLHILFASFMSPYMRIWLQILMSVSCRQAFAEVYFVIIP